jgi:hypothetical protein
MMLMRQSTDFLKIFLFFWSLIFQAVFGMVDDYLRCGTAAMNAESQILSVFKRE